VAISWYNVQIPMQYQEIATAFGLAMPVVIYGWQQLIKMGNHPA